MELIQLGSLTILAEVVLALVVFPVFVSLVETLFEATGTF